MSSFEASVAVASPSVNSQSMPDNLNGSIPEKTKDVSINAAEKKSVVGNGEEKSGSRPTAQTDVSQSKSRRKRKPAEKPNQSLIREGATSAQILAREAGYAPQVIKKWPPDPVYASAPSTVAYYPGWENEYAGTPYGNTSMFRQYQMAIAPPVVPSHIVASAKSASLRDFERELAEEDIARQAERKAAVEASRAEERLQALLDEIDYKNATRR